MRYRFGQFEVDTTSHTVTRAGRALQVWPKVFDLLVFLVRNPRRLVTKQELLDGLWSDSHVNEGAVPWTVSHARKALGQRGGDKHPIETVHGRGYRFTADVVELADEVAPAVEAPVRAAAGRGLPFVGRADVLAQLESVLLETRDAGRGGLCLLAGPAGIGKTRCMDVIAEGVIAGAATVDLFHVWSGRCPQDAGAPVFWPWEQILRGIARAGIASSERAAALLQQLRSLDAAGGADDGVPATNETFWWFDGVGSLLFDAAAQRPVLLLLDDLQWADAASLDMLLFLVPDLRRVPLRIVATLRDDCDPFHPAALSRLSRHAQRIELQPLGEDDVAAYLGEATGSDTLGAGVPQAVHRATAGNPLFLEHTVRALLSRHGDVPPSSLGPELVEPPSVASDVLGASLRRLDPDAQAVLGVASVLGETFAAARLAELCGRSAAEVLAALDAPLRQAVVVATAPHAFGFAHGLFRRVLYEGLPAQRRATLHRCAAENLERSAPERHGEIARHHYGSLSLGDHGRVAAAAEHAAQGAARMRAFADAARFGEWALEAQALQHDVPPRTRAQRLLFQAQMHGAMGEAETAQRHLVAAVEIARQHGLFDLLVRAARILRPTHMMGSLDNPLVKTILEEALDHAPQGANPVRVSALSQLSWVPPYGLDIVRAKELSGRGLELARELGDEGLLLHALHARLHALSGPDDMEALLAVVHEMLARDSSPRDWAVAAALGARYGAQLYVGDMAGAQATLAELGRMAGAHPWTAVQWYHDRLVLQRQLLAGDFGEAQRELAKLRQRGKRFRIPHASDLTDLLQGLIVIERGGPAALAEGVDLSLLRAAPQIAPVGMRPTLARLLLALGDAATARSLYDALRVDDFGAVPQELGYLHALANLAVLAIHFEDRDGAQCLYGLLSPYPHHNTPNVLLLHEGSVSHFLGLLGAFLGHREATFGHFDDALSMNEQLGQQPQLARTCCEYGLWLQRGPRSGHKRGSQLLERAHELGQRMQMAPLLARLAGR